MQQQEMKAGSAQAKSYCVYVNPKNIIQHIIPLLLDCWADPVAHLLLLRAPWFHNIPAKVNTKEDRNSSKEIEIAQKRSRYLQGNGRIGIQTCIFQVQMNQVIFLQVVVIKTVKHKQMTNPTNKQQSKRRIKNRGREPWSSDYGRRLIS